MEVVTIENNGTVHTDPLSRYKKGSILVYNSN
jgi:hypothetical protein